MSEYSFLSPRNEDSERRVVAGRAKAVLHRQITFDEATGRVFFYIDDSNCGLAACGGDHSKDGTPDADPESALFAGLHRSAINCNANTPYQASISPRRFIDVPDKERKAFLAELRNAARERLSQILRVHHARTGI